MFLEASLKEVQSWENARAAEKKPMETRTLKKKNLFMLLLFIVDR
jgi:hypothetical protein